MAGSGYGGASEMRKFKFTLSDFERRLRSYHHLSAFIVSYISLWITNTMAPIPIYLIDSTASLPDNNTDLQRIIHLFSTTMPPEIPENPVPHPFTLRRPEPPLSGPNALADLVDQHWDSGEATRSGSLILALDDQSLRDNTALLVAPGEDDDTGEVSLSDDDDKDAKRPSADLNARALKCRVVSEWVNVVTSNVSIGHNPSSHVRTFCSDIMEIVLTYLLIVYRASRLGWGFQRLLV